jgi:hypothetical protein
MEFLHATINDVFQGEEITIESLATYISSNDVLFGICEEPDDLTLLEEAYD